MRISTRARYGLRLMVVLGASWGGGPVLLREISRREEISEKYLSQIIIPLKSEGLVKSVRGARGGYLLARAPEAINALEIVETLEGDVRLLDCLRDGSSCSRLSHCVAVDLWRRVAESIATTLRDVTIADLVREYRQREGQAACYSI